MDDRVVPVATNKDVAVAATIVRRNAILDSVLRRYDYRFTPFNQRIACEDIYGVHSNMDFTSGGPDKTLMRASMSDRLPIDQHDPAQLGRREVSFKSLIEHRAEQVASGKLARNIHSNEKSALALFREGLQLPEDNSVSPWLTHGFDISLKKFEEFAAGTKEGKSRIAPKTVPSYLTRLRELHRVAEELEGVPIAFGEAFDLAVAKWIAAAPGRTVSELSKISGTSFTQIRNWRRPTASPRVSATNFATIEILERILNLTTGDLWFRISAVASAHDDEATHRPDKVGSTPSLAAISYIPKTVKLPEIMQEFYRSIEKHKINHFPGYNSGGKRLRA